MSGSKHGSAFLLQQMEPKRLIGTLGSEVASPEANWIYGSFFNEPGLFVFEKDGHETVLTIAWEVAMSLVGMFQVILAQAAYLRDPAAEWTAEHGKGSGKISVSVGPEKKKKLVLRWPSDIEGVTCRVVGEQTEWRIREDLALEIVGIFVRTLARIGAGR
jgi:hypothetical protein